MNEDAITTRLRRSAPLIGDDCAIITPHPGEELLFTTDFTIEGVHFKRSEPAPAVGRRALARSLSDIAAMGGEPRYCIVGLVLPPWADQRWVNGFYRGLLSLAKATGTLLAGGDLSHARQLVSDVMVCGAVPTGTALRRDGARVGDILYVSGRLGGWRNRRRIEPKLEFGRSLRGLASACMDITDGLALDLHRLATASGVAASLEEIPLLRGATIEQALYDGEDYELLYTAPPAVAVPGFRIGVMTDGKPGALRYRGRGLRPKGYDHFQSRAGSD